MEHYTDFENDSNFADFLKFEDDEDMEDMSSITQVCVDEDPEEEETTQRCSDSGVNVPERTDQVHVSVDDSNSNEAELGHSDPKTKSLSVDFEKTG